jgi:hypothetical protein
MQTVADVVAKAEKTEDVDLDTGLSKDEAAQRAAFLQVRTFWKLPALCIILCTRIARVRHAGTS